MGRVEHRINADSSPLIALARIERLDLLGMLPLKTDPELAAGIPAHLGTVELIVRAKQRGLIDRVRPVLDQLRRQRFRISPGLYEDALRVAGEWPGRPGAEE